MAIANGTCVSFCNQPKAHYLATPRESRRYVAAFARFAVGGIWHLAQESLRHILASPGYARGTIAVNVTRLERGFNAGKTPCCIIIPIYLQPFLRYSKLLAKNCDIFIPNLCLAAPQGV